MNQKEYINGVLKKKDGKYVINTQFTPESPVMDIELEEIIEDFVDSSVQISIEQMHTEKPIFEQDAWEKAPEKTCDPDYQHASPQAYEKFLDMKFGMMIHFGLYTHLGFLESWSVHNQRVQRPLIPLYYTLYQVFNPSEFNADEWANLAHRAGMQFFQCTTKHHEGFCMFDTKTKTKALKRIGHRAGVGTEPLIETEINFSIMDTPFKRDIIKELCDAFRRKGLGVGLYFSHIDWNDPNFRWDPANRSYDPNYSDKTHPEEWKAFIERERQQLLELFSNYGKIDQIFFDGTWFGLAWNELKSIVKELRKLQPDCMFSDRGIGPYADFTSPERWIPADLDDPKMTERPKVWQVCDPIGTHWSYVPDEKYKPTPKLIRNLVDAVAKGGTYVFDVNPMPNGKFPQETIDILEDIGRWLKINGEAIYNTRRYKQKFCEPDNEDIYYTISKDNKILHLIHFGWPYKTINVKDIKPLSGSKIFMNGVSDIELPWKIDENGTLVIDIPAELNKNIPYKYAYSLNIELSK